MVCVSRLLSVCVCVSRAVFGVEAAECVCVCVCV